MSVSAGDHPDVLGTDAPDVGRRPLRTLAVAVCLAVVLAAVLAAAVVALVQRQDRAAAPPVEVVGSMLLVDISSVPVELPSAHEQHRDGMAIGSIELELPDGQLRGDARLDFGASVGRVDEEPSAIHAWGEVRLRFGTNSCHGWFGWSSFAQPLEGGGSMHVRCEDGATLTARLAATRQPQAFGVAIDLEDGWYDGGG